MWDIPNPKKEKIMRQKEIKLRVYLNYEEWKRLTLKAEKVGSV